MAQAATVQRWFARDSSRALVLLVWAAFIIAVIVNVFDWPPFIQKFIAKPQPAAASKPPFNADAFYAGSIYFVPEMGDYCWQRMIDNRNGIMWDKGYVVCNDAVSELVESKERGSLSNQRMESISKAFNGDERPGR